MNDGVAENVFPMANVRMDDDVVAVGDDPFHVNLSIWSGFRGLHNRIEQRGHTCGKVRIVVLCAGRDQVLRNSAIARAGNAKKFGSNRFSIHVTRLLDQNGDPVLTLIIQFHR